MWLLHKVLAALLVFLPSCAALNDIFVFNFDTIQSGQDVQPSYIRSPHPKGESSVWVGKKASELVVRRGDPDLILETAVRGILLYGDSHTVSYVYYPDAESTAGCLDAYVVDHESEEILAFHCH